MNKIFFIATILLLFIPGAYSETADHDNQWMKGLSAVIMLPNNPIDAGSWDLLSNMDLRFRTFEILDARNGFVQISRDDKLIWINSAFIWSINSVPE